MRAHAEGADSTVDDLSHEESRRPQPMVDELARITELTFDDADTIDAATDAYAAFRRTMSPLEEIGLARKAKDAADMVAAFYGSLAKEFGKDAWSASSKVFSTYEESGLAKMAKDAADMVAAINGPLTKEFGKSAWAVSSKVGLDYMDRLGPPLDHFAAHELTPKWLTDSTSDSMKAFGAAEVDQQLKSESLPSKALKMDYMGGMIPTKMDGFMRSEVDFRSKLDLFDQLRGFGDLRRELGPATGFERSASFDRQANEGLSDLSQADGALIVPVSSFTIIKRKRQVTARCQVCRGPVEVRWNPDGNLETFSPCDCGSLARDILQDFIGSTRAELRPSLTLLQGDRSDTDGPGIPTGDLRIVRPVPDPSTGD